MQLCREQSEKYLNPGVLFSKKPTIYVEPEELMCDCAGHPELNVMKTKKREVRTMHIGSFDVHETIKICPNEYCKKIYRYEGLNHFLSPSTNFGYDVMEYIGYAMWRKSQTAAQIQVDLKANK